MFAQIRNLHYKMIYTTFSRFHWNLKEGYFKFRLSTFKFRLYMCRKASWWLFTNIYTVIKILASKRPNSKSFPNCWSLLKVSQWRTTINSGQQRYFGRAFRNDTESTHRKWSDVLKKENAWYRCDVKATGIRRTSIYIHGLRDSCRDKLSG